MTHRNEYRKRLVAITNYMQKFKVFYIQGLTKRSLTLLFINFNESNAFLKFIIAWIMK